jgi:hypothetical protein
MWGENTGYGAWLYNRTERYFQSPDRRIGSRRSADLDGWNLVNEF